MKFKKSSTSGSVSANSLYNSPNNHTECTESWYDTRVTKIHSGTYNNAIYIQLLSKCSLDSDFCHNYLHTLCT